MIATETLELLEWSRLCQHLSSFAATKLGTIVTRSLPIPSTLEESEGLLCQTKEVYQLESQLISGLSFEGIQDIGDSLERAELHGLLSSEELLAIATTLAGARNLRRVIDNQEDLPILCNLVSQLRTYPELEQEIHHCIDERAQIADRASQKLSEIREDLRKLRSQITQKLHNIIQVKSNALQELIITQRGDRYVLPVKAPQKDAVPGIVHDSSTSGATLYIEPNSIVSMGNQLRQTLKREQVEIEAILRILTTKVAEVKPDLEKLLAIVTTIDVAAAKARYSLWIEGNPPRLIHPSIPGGSSSEIITLRQLRHPLLVWQQKHEQGHPVVPVDLLISPHIKVVTITGPNTGGKTVTLKTLGLAALMAKVGLFIPAREPVEIPWFSHVLADIGDEQSLAQSLSTFSGHIRRISRILNAIGEERQSSPYQTSHSLILLDEVGAGTDPVEGSALAIALLKYLGDHAQLTIATTHFGELKSLKYEDIRFENASVEFNETTLSPTYRLLWGIPGRSNALAIALRLGLKPEVVENAKSQLGETTDEVNQVIAGLEAQRRSQETKAAAAQELLKQTEKLYKEVSQRATALEEREKDLRASQEIAVQKAITQAKAEIAQVIRQLQQGKPTAQDAQKATKLLTEIADKYQPVAPPKVKQGFIPEPGERVRIPKLGQTAQVISAADGNGELTVRFGMMKMTVNLEDVESLDGEKPLVPSKTKVPLAVVSGQKQELIAASSTSTENLEMRTSKNTVDLRGKRVGDAEYILDQVISQAAGPVWIIHGHGTGKLKQGVHEFLQQHPRVSHYEAASRVDGGTGVTIAHIK